MASDPELELGDVARAQGGVSTSVQALRAGFGRRTISHRLQMGRWVRVRGKVLAASTTSIDSPGQTWTALLLVGSSAVVSHRSAARLWNLEVPDGPLEISTSAARTARVDGATVRRRSLR